MSDKNITLTLEKRETLGKGLNKLRQEGKIPAVIHDHGKQSIHVMAPYVDAYKTFREAGKHHPVDLKVGSKTYLALIKDTDFEPRKNSLRHLVFGAIKQDEPVDAEIPIELVGEIPAERLSLMVLHHLEAVAVEALPKDLVDSLSVDASPLSEVGDKLTVADIKATPGLTIKTDPETVIATVEMPKDQVAEANAAAAEQAAEDAEGTAEPEAENGAEEEQEQEETDKPDESDNQQAKQS